ncbi:uncharacterized protein LOC119780000 [Cyprinodon tularosa]|uniref:uncharacterized protein LOC119780000 n=1 Tax=Cyprinodon tularosa TaxID=77115 RepID=UPI0018E23818|nr:uncharacterized protein LOC119780000 [Cyprinodon tularosa]
MSGRELLMMTFQTSPAEVELTCYYTVKKTDGGQHQSPDSNIQSVMINKVKELDSTTSQGVSTFSVTAGQTSDTTIKETDIYFTTSPATDGTTDQTFDRTSMKTDGFISHSPASDKPTLSGTTNDRDLHKSLHTEQKFPPKWLSVPPGVGVGVGMLLIVGLLCSRRRSDKYAHRRSQLIYNDNFIGMNSRPSRELLPVSDEDGYHMITSIPPADSATEPIEGNTQDSPNENTDVYHVYSTITDEPAESTAESPMYCSLQAH